MKFTSRIAETIEQQSIFKKNGLVLVALSGGADSVALLLTLRTLGYSIQALHCNFHLRGEESDRDEQFVRQLCIRLDIPCCVNHFDTRAYASQHKISIEMAARYLRYRWFEDKAKELNANHIAVAHHQNDQAETLMLNILRGTGIRGLAGMQYVNGIICRPLLDVSRNDILQYLKDEGQEFVTDSTNLERDAMRNRIRMDLIPILAQLNPSITQTLATMAKNIQDALPIYEKGLEVQKLGETKEEDVFQVSTFTTEEASLTLLYEWASHARFTRTQLENILQAGVGKIIESKTHRMLHDRHHYVLHAKNHKDSSKSIMTREVPIEEIKEMVKGNAYLDADLVRLPLKQRKVQMADRFTPLGMKGSKLVSDYLTDLKLNRFEKDFQEVVTDSDNHILWIVGHVTDHHYRITPSTRNVLIIETKNNK